MSELFDAFLPPVSRWFMARYGTPTQAQILGWPPIQRGEHTLILSPTGSGKTLAAFMWGINSLFAQLIDNSELAGVQLLYVSPLKALNNDIARNLEEPLAGIRAAGDDLGMALPELRAAVRTGDTSQAERRRMVRQPPHILITTPESLYLLLTSPVARDMLSPVRSVIVDEIHSVCGSKRGVHLATTLERLEAVTEHPLQRIGLSATQRPLEKVAHFLGGQMWEPVGDGTLRLVPRPVTLVDAGVRKPMDLRIVTPVADLRRLPGGSIWPALIPDALDEIRRHDTTLIFTNSRRAAERAADRLNEQYALEQDEEIAPGSTDGLLIDGVPKGQGMMGTGRVDGPFRAHHGSVSREVRFELEQDLKEGDLAALVATSSLELGIDIGSVGAVLQLQSPRGIARGLQRVGRSGHLVGQTSYGRIYATHREDLLDAAAVAHGMLEGDIEPTHVPQNCLDVLAQQIVAMVSVEPREVRWTYDLLRQAAGFEHLSWNAYLSVLKMVSGGFATDAYRGLRPCIVWDQVNEMLRPLPGSRLLAIRNAGTIPDRGEFRVYLPDGRTNLGTLDEEFVFETRVGDVFTLGSSTWRVMEIDEDRMLVADAAGATPRMPFWRGELPKRDYYMGQRLGAFRRELALKVADLPFVPEDPRAKWPSEAEPLFVWLAHDYAMDENSARNAVVYVGQQLAAIGAVSSDRTVVVERFADALGDQRMVIHSCFGARVNSVWAIALTHALRERLGTTVETQVTDDGILFRLLEGEREPPLDLIRNMTADEASERVLQELPNSALFGAQFRMNAARALVLPRVRGAGRRTPFWLQRLRAKDLLAISRDWEDFPLIAETYRDCLRDVLDVAHLGELLDQIAAGTITIVDVETLVPSPVAAGLLFQFAAVHLYDSDAPKLERQVQALSLNRELLGELLEEGSLPDLLRPEAIESVEAQLQHLAPEYQARSADELAIVLRELGDLSTEEIIARSAGEGREWLLRLVAERRALQIQVPADGDAADRWIAAENYARYRDAFGIIEDLSEDLPDTLLTPHLTQEEARTALLRRYFRTHGPVDAMSIQRRYGFAEGWLGEMLKKLVDAGRIVKGHLSPGGHVVEWCDRHVLERIHRETLRLLRQEIRPVPLSALADFTARWQGVHPAHRRSRDGLEEAFAQLAGAHLPNEVWERDVLSLRIADYASSLLDALCRTGEIIWVAKGPDAQHLQVRYLWRGEGAAYLDAEASAARLDELGPDHGRVYTFLQQEGMAHTQEFQHALRLEPKALEQILTELVLAGLVTNEDPRVLWAMSVGSFGRGDTAAIESSLDDVLDAWRQERKPTTLQPPSRARRRAARRRVNERLSGVQEQYGRWSIVHRYGVLGEPMTFTEQAHFQTQQLLARYGILARDLVDKDDGGMPWSAIYPQLSRMELRGEVRRGYFVRGLAGLQFALPEAVDLLREWHHAEAEGRQDLVVLNAVDPAQLFGPTALADHAETEGDAPDAACDRSVDLYRFDRISSNYVVLSGGQPLLRYEHGGERWLSAPDLDQELLRDAVRLCIDHLTRPGGLAHRPRRVVVSLWNGSPPVGQEIQSLLASLGFRRETPAMVWDGL